MTRAIAAIAVAALVATAAAQVPGGGGSGRGGPGGPGGTPSGRGAMGEASAPRVPGGGIDQMQLQLVELEEDLKLTPEQRRAWSVYADRMRSLAGDIARSRTAIRFPKGTVPQQFDFLGDTLRNRLTAFEDIAEAGKALYATLTPDQQEIADRRLARVAVSLLDIGAATASGPGAAPRN